MVKKAGRVRAYAQISLFGLIVIAKELVNFEQIDLVQAREIFIRDALVANQYGMQMKFLADNANKIKDIERIEDKLRRRDLLVDEESLYQFYDAKIPNHIASRKSFEEFYYDAENKTPNFCILVMKMCLMKLLMIVENFLKVGIWAVYACRCRMSLIQRLIMMA